MIRVSVDGHPDLSPFELKPPQTAKTVVEVVSGELEAETGLLKAGRHLYIGNISVLLVNMSSRPRQHSQKVGLTPSPG